MHLTINIPFWPHNLYRILLSLLTIFGLLDSYNHAKQIVKLPFDDYHLGTRIVDARWLVFHYKKDPR